MQQPDIMPTIFSYLNIDEPLFSYGNNRFDDTSTCYSVSYSSGIYQLVSDDFVLHFNGEKSVGFYNIKNDILLENNLIYALPEEVAFHEQKVKAIIQSFMTRLHKNQLFINKK